MAIFRRGGIYWFEFRFSGQRIQRSTRQANLTIARQIEAAYRTQLAKGEVGIQQRKRILVFREFAKRFLNHMRVHCAAKPRTFNFWEDCTNRLLKYEPIANARLDCIDEGLIAKYVEKNASKARPGTVNRSLAALRRALRLAQEWKELDRVPRIRMLPGEHVRDFVLSAEQRREYVTVADEPLKSIASFLLETGLRLGEALALTWEDVHINPVGTATRGYVAIRCGKSRFARRNVSLTATAQRVLAKQKLSSKSQFVFVREDGVTPVSRYTLSDQHERARTALSLPRDFVIHSLRHTMLTALGASGADSFTIMRIAGHSSITISQRYVHPTPESLERAFDRFETLQETPPAPAKRPPSTAKSTTIAGHQSAQSMQVVAGS